MSTYAVLKADIAAWLLRDDLTAAIPSFVRLAEAGIRRDVRTRNMIRTATLTLTAQSTPLPEDFLEMVRVVRDDTTQWELSYMPPAALYAHEEYHDSGTTAFYTLEGDNIITAPDGTGTDLLLSYYRAPTALSNDSDTNWLLVNAYDVFLYGALVHSAPYIRDDGRVALWNAAYNNAINGLNRAERRSMFAGGPLAIKAVSGP